MSPELVAINFGGCSIANRLLGMAHLRQCSNYLIVHPCILQSFHLSPSRESLPHSPVGSCYPSPGRRSESIYTLEYSDSCHGIFLLGSMVSLYYCTANPIAVEDDDIRSGEAYTPYHGHKNGI